MGPAPSGLSAAIESMPDKEAKDRLRADARVRDRDGQDRGGDQEACRARGAVMRTATTVELSRDPAEVIQFAIEAEKLGLDVCWVAEAWGSDAPSVLGYLAARTDRMLLGSGILQVGVRSPVMVAQTAITLSNLSNGRFLLGLGASGPQVIEGLHGLSFSRPLARIARNRRHRAAGVRRRQNLVLRQGVSDSTPRRGGGADAAVDHARALASRSTWRRCRRPCCG